MPLTRTTRTHLIYQFIILTLLFLGIGYNELLPERKFILFLAFIPMFFYQLLILSCCTGILPVPSWMNFEETARKTSTEKGDDSSTGTQESSVISEEEIENSQLSSDEISSQEFPASERHVTDWKSVSDLENTPEPEYPKYSKRAKSWINLSDSRKKLSKKSDIKNGSTETLISLIEKEKADSSLGAKAKTVILSDFQRQNTKRRSWKQDPTPKREPKENQSSVPSTKNATEYSSPKSTVVKNDETEIIKSYSFPFRQKRLEKWIELKENRNDFEIPKDLSRDDSNVSDIPYWQTVGYNLAVKYEARRRKRADSSPGISTESEQDKHETKDFEKSCKILLSPPTSSAVSVRKSANRPFACVTKVKVGITNFICKNKKCEKTVNQDTSKEKMKNKNELKQTSPVQEKTNSPSVPELPKFMSSERPYIFYPKYIPFEKDRFEKDVKKKMVELGEEQSNNFSTTFV